MVGLFVLSRVRTAHDLLKPVWVKLITYELMLTKVVHRSTLIGTSTFQYRCNRKFENPIYMSVPRARAAHDISG